MTETRAQTVRLLRTRSVCSNYVRGALSFVRNLQSGNTEVKWFHQSPRSITLCKSKEEEGSTGWKLLLTLAQSVNVGDAGREARSNAIWDHTVVTSGWVWTVVTE